MAKKRQKLLAYRYELLSIFYLLCVLVFPQPSFASNEYKYEPGKLIENKAELYCQSLASMSLGRQEIASISIHTKPNFIGTSHKGKKVIVVSYPYRSDGIKFGCIFNDYTNGELQLLEFGHAGPNVDDITKVKLLY